MKTATGRGARWETGGTEEVRVDVDISGTCVLTVENWGIGNEATIGLEITTVMASEMIAFLAQWLASEAEDWSDLYDETEKEAETLRAAAKP